jgi:hypothetical protein
MLIDPQTLQDAPELDLLSTYESILGELARRGVIRTNDSPIGQSAEWLAARVLDGVLEANSVKSHDLGGKSSRATPRYDLFGGRSHGRSR